MRLYSAIIAIVLGMMLVACGAEETPADTAEDATVEPTALVDSAPRAQETAVEAPSETPRPSPTSYTGSIPSPVVVSAAAARTPTAAATSTPMPAATPTPITQPTAPPASPVVASPTLTPERTEAQDDCGDFATHREAQLYFLEQGGPIDDPFGLDTDGDGIACNAETDTGYERIAFTLFSAATATPAPTATPIPTVQPLPSSANIWSSPERTAELNSIDWRAFDAATTEYSVRAIRSEGWDIQVYWTGPDGTEYRDVECGPHFGNRLDKANPTYHIRHRSRVDQSDTVTIWIEPADGSAPFCATVDKYRDWKATDVPLGYPYIVNPSGRGAVWGEPIVFPAAGEFTVRPEKFDYGMAIGRTFEVLEGELECVPHKMPLAVWSPGFEVLGREEEELVARYGFRGFKVDASRANDFAPGYSVDYSADSSEYWESYDWESKEFWRSAGWFLLVGGWSHYSVEGGTYPPPYREGGVIYDIVPDSDARAIHYCWRVPNVADLPEPRSCIECERHRNLSREVKDYHERNE